MHGLPASWESSIATMNSSDFITATAWSPSSRTIAISRGFNPPTIGILDAVALVQLTTLDFPMGDVYETTWLIFSPDGYLLTWFGYYNESSNPRIITWDLQTGVVVSSISTEQEKASQGSSVTYSACGTMLGVSFHNSDNPDDYTLSTYNTLSGTHIYSHSVKGEISNNIWVCGEHLQFATIGTGFVTIWEVGFVSTHPPTEIETYTTPDGFHSPDVFLSHPTLPRFALKKGQKVCIWSAQDSKFLLDPVDYDCGQQISFSPNGHFFACCKMTFGKENSEILLWKESHTGYILHRRLTSNLYVYRPLISPDEGSVIVVGNQVIQLWHTMDSSTFPPTISQNHNHFILEFSPNQVFASIVRLEDEMVIVLDLKSGAPKLIIDTGMRVYGLGINENSIVAVGDGKIVTWNLTAGDHIPDLRLDITSSVQTVTFNHRQFNNNSGMPAALVSPNLHCIAIKDGDRDGYKDSPSLYLYGIPTGQHFGTVPVEKCFPPWFTLDGCEVWCSGHGSINGWKIIEDIESNITGLAHLESTQDQPDGSPWKSSHGYQLVDHQWICNSRGKRLFWLPPHWRSSWPSSTIDALWQWRVLEWYPRERTWSGQFLALSYNKLSEAVILELE